MPGPIDYNSFYENVTETWKKVNADIISHLLIFLLVFVVAGVRLPVIVIPVVYEQRLLDCPAYQLLKEFNLLYLVPLLCLALVVAYGAMLHTAGKIIFNSLWFLKPNPNQLTKRFFNPVNRYVLEIVALTLRDENFSMNELTQALTKKLLEYKFKRKDEYEAFTKGSVTKTKSANIYLLNTCAFLVIAFLLYWCIPSNSDWMQHNKAAFRLALLLLILFFLAVYTRWRFREKLSTTEMLGSIIVLLKAEPGFVFTGEEAENRLRSIRKRIDSFKRDWTRYPPPSLRKYFLDTFHLHSKQPTRRNLFFKLRKVHRQLYKTGSLFAFRHREIKSKWLTGYIAYRYFQLCRKWRWLIWKITGDYKQDKR